MITNFSVGTSTATAAYTAAADVAVTVIYITNKSATDGNVDVYLVPSANVSSFESSPSQNYKIYNNLLRHDSWIPVLEYFL
jgi:hypothetical protein